VIYSTEIINNYFLQNDFEVTQASTVKKRKASSENKSGKSAEPAPKKIKLSTKDPDVRMQDNKVKETSFKVDIKKSSVHQSSSKTYKKKSPNKNNSKIKTKIKVDALEENKPEVGNEPKNKRQMQQKSDDYLSDKATPPTRRANLKFSSKKSSRSPSRVSAGSERSFEEHEGNETLKLRNL